MPINEHGYRDNYIHFFAFTVRHCKILIFILQPENISKYNYILIVLHGLFLFDAKMNLLEVKLFLFLSKLSDGKGFLGIY